MAKAQHTIKWVDMSGGVVQKISPDIKIPNSVPFSMNLIYDKIIGEAISRQGTTIVGTQVSPNNSCLGLFQHIDSTFTNSVLFGGFAGSIYNIVTGASSISGLNSSAKMRFATFLNTTLMLNGVTADARSYTAAGGWVTTGGVLNVAGLPASAQFPIEYKDRMYCAVTDRLYYTNTPTAGSVSWSASGSGSIQIEQEDGGGTIQGLNKVPGYLMIYKQRSLKRWNFDSTFPEDLVNIGTQSNESIVRARGKNFFFYGPNGFYETNGGYPVLISRPIQRFIDGISSSNYQNVAGWSDNVDIWWSVGNVTVDFNRGYTETYTNVVLKYHIDSQQWAPLRYAHAFKFLGQYINSSSAPLVVGGDANGQVLQLNTGNTDYNNQPITYILQTPEFDFGIFSQLGNFISQRELLKTISEKIFVHSDRTTGAQILKRLDYGNWQSFGTVQDIVTEVKIREAMTAHVFEFRITDSITGPQVKMRGLGFPNVDILESSS